MHLFPREALDHAALETAPGTALYLADRPSNPQPRAPSAKHAIRSVHDRWLRSTTAFRRRAYTPNTPGTFSLGSDSWRSTARWRMCPIAQANRRSFRQPKPNRACLFSPRSVASTWSNVARMRSSMPVSGPSPLANARAVGACCAPSERACCCCGTGASIMPSLLAATTARGAHVLRSSPQLCPLPVHTRLADGFVSAGCPVAKTGNTNASRANWSASWSTPTPIPNRPRCGPAPSPPDATSTPRWRQRSHWSAPTTSAGRLSWSSSKSIPTSAWASVPCAARSRSGSCRSCCTGCSTPTSPSAR